MGCSQMRSIVLPQSCQWNPYLQEVCHHLGKLNQTP